jgi:hypothetical protein
MRCLIQKGDNCEYWCDTDHEGNDDDDDDSNNHDISNDGNNVDKLLLIILMMLINDDYSNQYIDDKNEFSNDDKINN